MLMAKDFNEFTGKGVRIAIVDSGINIHHPEMEQRMIRGVSIGLNLEGKLCFDTDYDDLMGHGTACAGIVRQYAPDVEIYAVRILDARLHTFGIILAEAISWCIKNSMNAINLSAGTTRPKYKNYLNEVCKSAAKVGIMIVAAAHPRGVESYPSSFPYVFGVGSTNIQVSPGYLYQNNGRINFFAYGGKQRVCWLRKKYKYVSGTSFAAPHLSGNICKILEKFPGISFEEMKNILIMNAFKGGVNNGM